MDNNKDKKLANGKITKDALLDLVRIAKKRVSIKPTAKKSSHHQAVNDLKDLIKKIRKSNPNIISKKIALYLDDHPTKQN
ncbi:MAG: hypothetical protein JJV97_02935 [SAR324 cluster bacterium]|nr:hypothetical protein [SAR324 cluster bacterium]